MKCKSKTEFDLQYMCSLKGNMFCCKLKWNVSSSSRFVFPHGDLWPSSLCCQTVTREQARLLFLDTFEPLSTYCYPLLWALQLDRTEHIRHTVALLLPCFQLLLSFFSVSGVFLLSFWLLIILSIVYSVIIHKKTERSLAHDQPALPSALTKPVPLCI